MSGMVPKELLGDGCRRVLPIWCDDTRSSNATYYEVSDRNSVAEVDLEDLQRRLRKSDDGTRGRRNKRRRERGH